MPEGERNPDRFLVLGESVLAYLAELAEGDRGKSKENDMQEPIRLRIGRCRSQATGSNWQ